jgi:hypothetical protein
MDDVPAGERHPPQLEADPHAVRGVQVAGDDQDGLEKGAGEGHGRGS